MTFNKPENPENESTLNDSDSDNLSPEDETPPTSATTLDVPSFGWSKYAERVNGRFAMIGFLAVILIESLNHSAFLKWAGLIP